MGIVLKQSLQNTLITYMGFGIGALNTLVLYTHLMADEDYGLVQVVLSVGAVLTPLFSFGVPNTLVKYFSGFKGQPQDGFLTLMLFLPLLGILPLWGIVFLANEASGHFWPVRILW